MVNSMKIGQAFCQAVGSIVGKQISVSDFNTTRKGIITSVQEAAIGKYKVRHQDAEWIAYSPSGVTYTKDTEVYLVNVNNNTEQFFILGSITPNVTEFSPIPTDSDGYDVIGVNLINENSRFGLVSYERNKEIYLYRKDSQEDSFITFNPQAFDAIHSAKGIAFSATFQTKLKSQQYGGNYGIQMELVFEDENNASENAETVKSLILDTSNVIGSPYSLTIPSRVETLYTDFDPEKFKEVKSIKIFVRDFKVIHEDTTQDSEDIFISNIKVNGANPLTEQELTGYKLHINYSANGNVLQNDITELKLVPELKVKGKIINSNVTYYWYRRNATVFRGSSLYHNLGGEGWECLNPKDENTRQFIPSSNEFYVTATPSEKKFSAQMIQKDTIIKCLAKYNDNIEITGQCVITNNNVSNNIYITSSDKLADGETNKTVYYLDAGSPTLTCNVEDVENGNYIYTWIDSSYRNRNSQQVIQQTDEQNSTRNSIVSSYEEFQEKRLKVPEQSLDDFDSNEKGTIQDDYNNLQTSYCYKNKYYNYPINKIVNSSVISCAVERQQGQSRVYIGTGSITLENKHELANTYSLNITNDSQVFQYDSKGNSPCSAAVEKPLTIPKLTFVLVDADGNQIEHDFIKRNGIIRWTIPKQNTLLLSQNSADISPSANGYVIENISSLSFSIADQYDSKKKNNQIQLYIQFKVNGEKVSFIAYTNFTFAKDGDPGTNGTDYVAKITPSETTDRIYLSTDFPTKVFGDDGRQVAKLEFQLYNNSIKQQDLITNKLTYKKGINQDNEWYNIQRTNGTGVKPSLRIRDYSTMPTSNPVNILRGIYQPGNIKYYAEYPININYIVPGGSTHYRFKLRPRSGFKYVLYNSDGTSPSYDNTLPFEAVLEQYITKGEGYGYYIQQQTGIYYEWQTFGNLEPNHGNGKFMAIEPKDTFDGQDLTSAIWIKFYKNQNYLGYLYAPIYMLINRYNNAALNDWDGNSIDLGENNGTILAPQIGAGKKDQNTNTFTGVVMGVEKIGENQQIGLFGYESGQRSIFLDSQTGKAEFGKQGEGKIVIDPRNSHAQIYSGNYQVAELNQDGSVKTAGAGMLIDLTEPYIDFGSGDFKVNSDGHITARGGGTIAGWNISNTALTSPNGKLKLENTNINFKDSSNNTIFDIEFDGNGSTASIAGWTFSNKDMYHLNSSNSKVGINSDPNNSNYTVNNHESKAFFANGDNFFVTHDGYLRSKSGKIANWNINENSLNDGNLYLGNSSRDAFGQTGIQARIWDSNNNFIVSVAGKIYSKSGKIGNWNIEENRLYSGDATNGIRLNSSGDINGGNPSGDRWSISRNGYAYFNKIDTANMNATNMQATNATVSGKITTGDLTATGGTIGGITINNSSISGSGWWINSGNAHFNGLIVDSDGSVKSSSSSSGISGGSGGSGWNFPGGNSKPTMTYDNYTITPQQIKVIKKLALTVLTNDNMIIPTSIIDGKVASYVSIDKIAMGWTGDTELQSVQAMVSTPQGQSIG